MAAQIPRQLRMAVEFWYNHFALKGLADLQQKVAEADDDRFFLHKMKVGKCLTAIGGNGFDENLVQGYIVFQELQEGSNRDLIQAAFGLCDIGKLRTRDNPATGIVEVPVEANDTRCMKIKIHFFFPAFCDAGQCDNAIRQKKEDRIVFYSRFEKGQLVMLLLEQGEEVHRYFISTAATNRNQAMCCGTFLETDERNTKTFVNKAGLSGAYQVRVIIDDIKYETGVEIVC